MRLERIRLKMFGCFQQQDFELSDGINLIFGPNFSGKSTLVNAIFYTLTGKPIVPRVDAAAIKNAKSNSGTAGLQFVEDGERYMLFRGTGRRFQLRHEKDGEWYIIFDEKRVTVIEAALKERFGIMHDRLALTAFLREGEIFEFLARQPATRRDILYALLGIDKLIDVRERFIDARRLAKRERNRIQAHQNSLRFSAQNVHKIEIERIEAKLKELESAYSMETGDAELIAEWKQNRKQTQTQLDTLTQEQKENLSGFNNISHLQGMIDTIKTAIEEASELEKERETLIQKIGSLNSQIAALTNVCESLCTLIDNDDRHCPTCHQQVEQEIIQKIVAEKESEKSQLSTELESDKKTLAEKTENLGNRQELEQRFQTLQTRVSRLEHLDNDISKIATELDTLTMRLREKGALDEAETMDASINNDVQSSHPIPTNLDKRQLKAQIDSQRKRLENLKQQEAVQSDRLERLQQVNAEAEEVEKTTLCLELACAGIEKTIDTLQRQILKPVEEELHRWLGQMELFGRTQIDLQRQHLLPSINIDGVDRSLMLLSGSEKMFLYLCFKVALAKVLGNPGFFVFDDPTLHLDSERKTLMVQFIRQLAEEHQVVVTTYDEDVRAGLEGAHLIEMKRES